RPGSSRGWTHLVLGPRLPQQHGVGTRDRDARAGGGQRIPLRAEPGRLLAKGREADVFEADPGRVLRRYRNRDVLDNEVVAMRWACRQGYPAPQLFDVEGTDMLMERLPGHTMLSDLRLHPWRARSHADLLARLHSQLHALPPPPDLELRYPLDGDTFLHL